MKSKLSFYYTLLKMTENRELSKIPCLVSLKWALYHWANGKGIKLIENNGSKIYVDLQDTGITPGLLRNSYEAEQTDLFKRLIDKNKIIVDVGANIGYYTLLGARLGKKVYAFEPDKGNYDMLIKNIKVNKYKNIKPFNKAVSDNKTPIKFYIDSDNRGGSSFGKSNVTKVGEEKKIIPVLLDEVLLGKRVDLIKIDTQGAELRVIKGAIRLIKQNPNLNIMMEFCPIGIKKVGDNPLEILTLLKSLGFTARLIETGKMISFEKLSKIKEQESLNLLLSRVLVENQG